ncbi:PucR family transcriptional regulator [Actinoallomurus soli]|uniref:PucR family transcriptional regulator n=1 Tax=Actinoallomurus soli TaxID=2952535 RepID=UPI0020921D42|nr:PucR family transcriptional regulator [Actinoallomurus soli]MCO5969311.1 helix-turn-helix domain-containing protein [Actinoallomurus soli]
MTAIRDEQGHGLEHTADDLRKMHREAASADGLERLLRWLAGRVDGTVVLLDRYGAPLHAFPEVPWDILRRAAGEVDRVVTGEVRAAVAEVGGSIVHIQRVGVDGDDATLVVIRRDRFTADVRVLIGDAAQLVGLRRRADALDLRYRRVDRAERQAREAVLDLLMVGQFDAARRVAATLGPALADPLRVFVVEGPPAARARTIDHCEQASGGRAWIVRCLVYSRHVIVLAPASAEPDDLGDALCDFVDVAGGVKVGGSDAVALRDFLTGYEQAFHALAVARNGKRRFARFSRRGELAALVRPRGYAWVAATLEPLTGHRPQRAQDPDAAALTTTLGAWLDFYGGAARQLKIHRNTLAARLRYIEGLLRRPLSSLDTQATLHLALRVLGGPAGADGPATLEELLDDPEVRRWADLQVAPLLRAGTEPFMTTLRVWLANDARLDTTASALGISPSGVRKRLIRTEEVLGRSLLNGPSARYDLWFALKVLDT